MYIIYMIMGLTWLGGCDEEKKVVVLILQQ
jgi:hypothetical protein